MLPLTEVTDFKGPAFHMHIPTRNHWYLGFVQIEDK
jgi:hypothetical protein